MIIKPLTLQKTLAIALLLIGAIGVSLVFITDYTYRQLAYQQQKDSVSHLIAIKSADLISKLSDSQKDLGFRLQSEPAFTRAIDGNNKKDIIYWLDQEFNRYHITIGLIKLEKIIIYDNDFNEMGSSKRGINITGNKKLPCTQIITQIKSLPDLQRSKPASQLCKHNNRPLLSTVIPVGNLKPKAYMQLLSDPAHILTQIETELGIPLKIFNLNQDLLHQSINWPANKTAKNHLVSTFTIRDKYKQPILHISAASDITAFKNQLNDTRFTIILGSSALTLSALLIALIILQRGLLPLKNLSRAANSSARGEFSSVEENGYNEISAPIHAFNLMTGKIQTLISDLKKEVEKHKKTQAKFKQAKEVAEQHARETKKQSNFLHMTMQSIVDGVITTDINGYVNSINPMAERLTGWTEAEAKGKPLIQVMHALKEDTHKRIYAPTENIEHKTVLDEPVSAILIQNNSNIETPVEYIVAPMHDHEDEIAGIVIIIHDESVQRSLNRLLTFQATHDALTGLINRHEFERRLKSVISSQLNTQSQYTLCYIDLDQFKLVNDTCGHTAGDELLIQITSLLQNNLHGVGTLARLGGNEFGLLLENCDIINTQKIARDLLDAIQQFQFNWNGSTFTISASIGISLITDATISCGKLLSNADAACCLAKESGRNHIQVLTEEDDKLLTQQRETHWVSRINHALEENRFQLYFQEIAPLNQQHHSFILHGEILLRMIDKEGDVVSPGSFLHAAERYNMITQIDEWVIEKSIQWLASRKDKVLISVNLSSTALSNRDFLNFVVSKIKQYRINPELICFEITETAAIDHLTAAIHFMTVLKKLGCSFALDDFGSGFSSFSYLSNLPVDYLKISGSFVMDIDKDPMHYAMVKAINEVGQVMGIKTIAEYAASEAIIQSLHEIGVDNAQGYAIARPIPLSSLVIKAEKPVLVAVNKDKPAS